VIRPAQDLRSRVWRRMGELAVEEGRKDGEGRRKEDRERRWQRPGEGMEEEGVVSRDEGWDSWEEKDA